MTYKSIKDLPKTLQETMPEEAQELYLERYNKSWEAYDAEAEPGELSREAVAHRDGWAAVKREYIHDEDKGIWYRKGEEEAEAVQEEEEQNIIDRLKGLV